MASGGLRRVSERLATVACLVICLSRAAGLTADFPIHTIPLGTPLPRLDDFGDDVFLTLTPTTLVGPGTGQTGDSNPYVLFTGRTYNDTLTPGVIRVPQGGQLNLRICNLLDKSYDTLQSDSQSFDFLEPPQTTDDDGAALSAPTVDFYKDANIYGNHFHGYFGSPGTNNVPCEKSDAGDEFCVVGDNVFENIFPGACGEYHYPITPEFSPSIYWIHPHHLGSDSNQAPTASIPVIVEHAEGQGFDFYSDPSCAATKSAIHEGEAEELIMHIQAFTLNTDLDGFGVGDDYGDSYHTGPTDDGMISTAASANDPYCCKGPDPSRRGKGSGTWDDVGSKNGTGPDIGTPNSLLPFKSMNGEFIMINGVYQPVIEMQADRVYLLRMVAAFTMKVLDLSFNTSGCSLGLTSRDSIPLAVQPRMTDHVMLAPANRAEAFLQCEPGVYALQAGHGTLQMDPNCTTTHCEFLNQTIVATIVVTAPEANSNGISFADIGTCLAINPPYLASLMNGPQVPNALNTVNVAATFPIATTYWNMSNPAPGGPGNGESGACAFNGLNYNETAGFQEINGVTQEFNISYIAFHPFHHHIQPFQIITIMNPYGNLADNGTWQAGDWADTLLLPSLANQAILRWTTGPREIVGEGYTLMHCHIVPHNDEGCVMKIQIVNENTPPNALPPIAAAAPVAAGGRR